MTTIEDPLRGAPPKEVPLERAPLLRVIAQVRFPEILAVEQREFVAPFQEAIRSSYPILRQEQTQGLMITTAGVAAVKPQTAWRFSDASEQWRVSLTAEFLALETTKYTSRKDFLARLRVVLEALDHHVEPKLADRLGVRYIDRLAGDDVDQVHKLVRAEVRGLGGLAIAESAVHALSETMFALDDAQVLARWGLLPPERTVDPGAIEPVSTKTWILDLDMFTTKPMPFAVERLLADAEQYMARIYALFRWVVTDDFLRHFGGKP